MHITGFPRAGTSLLLLLCAATVTNREVYSQRETRNYAGRHGWISKDPFTALHGLSILQPLFVIRHPQAVLTSKHGKGYRFYWDRKRGARSSPFGLRQHISVLGEPRLKYEDLCSDPDGVQAWIGEEFALEFSRPWSEWPYDDFRIPEYWLAALGAPRPIRPARMPKGEMSEEVATAARALGYD